MRPRTTKVTLVGAGPGDPELITLKGIRALQTADVVLYDALVNKTVPDYAPRRAIRILVGKRPGRHSFTQDEINELMVSSALSYGHVVRLKGGDPFVFGRGHEEIDYLREHGIETEVIPGISSALAVPGLAGIPLTSRGTAESFWVVTGATTAGGVSRDMEAAARSGATVVVLMGIGAIERIARIFRRAGRGNLPFAIIQNGSLPEERIVTGTVRELDRAVDRWGIGPPAVIVIGETVNLMSATAVRAVAKKFDVSPTPSIIHTIHEPRTTIRAGA